MTLIELMNREQIWEALETLKSNWRGYRAQVAQQNKLLKYLYMPNKDKTPIFFYAQDTQNFPINNPITNKKSNIQPTLLLTNIVPTEEWSNIKGINGLIWPPIEHRDLILLNYQVEVCLICNSNKICYCESLSFSTKFKDREDWTTSFCLKAAKGKGYGIFAIKEFKNSHVLGQYVGELLPKTKANSKSTYNASLSIGKYNQDYNRQQKCFIDAQQQGSVFRFLNHSCKPNAELLEQRCGIERILVVVTKQDILKGEEVTINYGEGYFGCKCLCQPCLDSKRYKRRR